MADQVPNNPSGPAPDKSPADPAGEALEAVKAAVDDVARTAESASAPATVGIPSEPTKPGAQQPTPQAFDPPDFERSEEHALAGGIDLLADVNLTVKIELGRTRMLVEDVLKLRDGSVVELDKLAGDPVDIYVNDRPVARGEVLVLNENFCVRINEILTAGGEEVAKR